MLGNFVGGIISGKGISPENAYDILSNSFNGVMVDIRSDSDVYGDGIPDLRDIGKRVNNLEFNDYDFIDRLRSCTNGKGNEVIFICRSGTTSPAAVMSANNEGYSNCYFVKGGFLRWIKDNLPVMSK